MLTVTKKVVLEVDYIDLDEAITTFLKSKSFTNKDFDKFGYESTAENEWNNDCQHSFEVYAELPDVYDQEKLSANEEPSTNALLNWMCADGLIEPGEYLVNVSW
jgi:hypothetical protein